MTGARLAPVVATRGSTTALDALLARVHAGESGAPLLAAIEDALATASLEALKLDVLRRRITASLDELASGPLEDSAVKELGILVARRAQLERDAAALRARVADLREAFGAMGGTRIVDY